jgi:hypothetical protein
MNASGRKRPYIRKVSNVGANSFKDFKTFCSLHAGNYTSGNRPDFGTHAKPSSKLVSAWWWMHKLAQSIQRNDRWVPGLRFWQRPDGDVRLMGM